MNKIQKTCCLLPLVVGMAATSAADVGDTKFTYGGFIKLDAMMSSYSDGALGAQSLGRDFYIPSLTPIGGADEDSQFDFHAKSSRFFVGTETKLDNGKSIKTKVEYDFHGTGGNERVSNSYSPRLRHAFVTYDGWLFGQTWSTFQDVGALPESVDFIGVSEGTIFTRQSQIRYSTGNFSIAIENPETTVTPYGGGGRIVADDNSLPDLAANYKINLDNGYLKVSGLMRQLSYTGGAVDDDESSYGVSFSGRLNFGQDNLKFMLSTGAGMGRYAALNASNGAVIDSNNQLNAIDSTLGFVAYQHHWGDGWRSNFIYSVLDVDNDPMLVGAGVTESAETLRVNLAYSPAKKLTFGIEASQSKRENSGNADGDMTRVQFTAKYAF